MKKFLFSVGVLSLFTSVAFAGVNVNTLDAETLAAELDGIGLSKAQAIVEYRKEHGDFQAIDELVNVKGIGAATVEKNREVIELTQKKPVSTNQ